MIKNMKFNFVNYELSTQYYDTVNYNKEGQTLKGTLPHWPIGIMSLD